MKRSIRYCIDWSKSFLKSHGAALVLALLVGATSVAPHLLAQNSLGADYQGFPLLFHSNEDYYMARIQDIVDGHWMANSPYLYEFKDKLSLVLPVGEYLYALPALLFNIPVVSVLMAAKFIFPALLFWLIYILLYNLSKRTSGDKINSIFGGLLITLGFYFVNYKDTWSILTGRNANLYLSDWTRPVNPITGAILLFIFLILFWKSLRSDKRHYSFASGVVLGVMPVYIFSWMTALAVMSAVISLALLRRHFVIIKNTLFVVLGGILAGMPVWYLWFRSFFTAEDGQLAASRFGLMTTHYPIFNKVVLAQTIFFLVLFLFEWSRKRKCNEKIEEWWWFAWALVVGNWLVFNQQIITGRTIWPPHLTQYTVPLAFLTFVLLLGNYLKILVPRLWSLLVIAISGVIVFFIVMTTLNYNSMSKEFSEMQRFMPFFDWLNSQTAKDCVVLAKEKENREFLSRWIPAFTHCNTYLTAYYPQSAPLERIYFNYVVSLRLQGVERKDLEQYLWDNKADLRILFYTSWSQAFVPADTVADDRWLAGPIRTIIDNYDSLLKEDFTTALRRYRIDYLVSEEPLSALLSQQLPSLYLLDKVGTVYIYQL